IRADSGELSETTRAPSEPDQPRRSTVRHITRGTPRAGATREHGKNGGLGYPPPRTLGPRSHGHNFPAKLVTHDGPMGHRRPSLEIGSADPARSHTHHELARA